MKIAAFFFAVLATLALANAIDVGDDFPEGLTLHHGFPPETIKLDDRLKGKNVLIVGLPGAFTPTWSSRQVPGYLAKQGDLQKLGVDDIIVYCVNDGAVMAAWATDQKVASLKDSEDDPSKILHLYADPYGLVTTALGMELTHKGPKMKGLIGRSKRFAMYVVDGKVEIFKVAEAKDDPAGDDKPDITLAEAMMHEIKKYNKKAKKSGDEL